jgi:hypothetical protein
MNRQELDRATYVLAKDFLLRSGADKGVTPELIEKYLHLSTPRPNTLAGVYERLLVSAQNANMKAGVIGGSINGINRLGQVLCDFRPARSTHRLSREGEGQDEELPIPLWGRRRTGVL